MPFEVGNKLGGRRKEKPWRDALMLSVNRLMDGQPDRKKLQAIADQVVEQALAGDMRAAEEIGNRLDGRVPQALIGSSDPDDPPLTIGVVQLVPVIPALPELPDTTPLQIESSPK